ncbi:endonuclease domain-containing protein [Lysobacter tyrosinilyticus]
MDVLRTRARELRSNATDAEKVLWRALRGKQLEGFRFRRQVPIAGFIADFLCPQARLIIELDGGQHAEQGGYDAARTTKLAGFGYRVLRYWNNDVLARTEAVLEDIHSHLLKSNNKSNSTPPQPSPSLREREGAKGNGEDEGNKDP